MSTYNAIAAKNDISSHPRIEAALKRAARATGVDFKYLVDTATRESNLKTGAKSKASSATGLFQFIDETWLSSIKEFGPKFGMGRLSSAIVRDEAGRHRVSSPSMRKEILALRTDPGISALMAGAYAGKSTAYLREQLAREPRQGEVYITHFLGIKGGGELIVAASQRPNSSAARMFPSAARSNPSIFYDKRGSALSVRQVYHGLVSKHSTQIASASPASKRVVRIPGQPLKLNAEMLNKSGHPTPLDTAQRATGNYRKASFQPTTAPVAYNPTSWPVKPQPFSQEQAQYPVAGPGSLGYEGASTSRATATSSNGSLVRHGKQPFATFASAGDPIKAYVEKKGQAAGPAVVTSKPTVLDVNEGAKTGAITGQTILKNPNDVDSGKIGQIFVRAGKTFFALRGKQ